MTTKVDQYLSLDGPSRDYLTLEFHHLLFQVVYMSRHFSPTAIALGSSAIKVSGQNRFWTLYGSLGQIRLGLPKGSAAGLHQGLTKVLQVWWCLWFSRADQSWAAKRFRGRFDQGSTKVLEVSWCLVSGFLGHIRLGLPKGSVGNLHEVPPRFHQGLTCFIAWVECVFLTMFHQD